jgi:hypothetical protein
MSGRDLRAFYNNVVVTRGRGSAGISIGTGTLPLISNLFATIFRNMPSTADQVATEALGLPVRSRALLVEKLLASLSGVTSPEAERAHLDEVRRRREAVRSGQGELIDGEEALRCAKAALRS